MGVIRGRDISILIKFFKENNIQIYHACQLKDFASSLQLGGVPSRSLLQRTNSEFTAFSSDNADMKKGFWDKVFFNFNDFGNSFHERGNVCTPNVYGPIVLKFNGDIFENASDVSISLCSVTDPNFDRERDSLSLEQVKQLFNGKFLKSKKELQEIFPGSKVMVPEMNVHYMGNDRSEFEGLREIIVDPIHFNNLKLAELIKKLAKLHLSKNVFFIRERKTINGDLYNGLLECSVLGINSEVDLWRTPLSVKYPIWLEKSLSIPPARGFMMKNFLKYLQEGTMIPMLAIGKINSDIA